MKEFEEMIWCTAVRFGGADEWNFAWSKIAEHSGADRRKVLKSLACTRDASRARKLMARAFHPEVKQETSDTRAIFDALADNADVTSQQIHFIVDNWQRLTLK